MHFAFPWAEIYPPHRHVPLHARSSPRTRQIRDATAQTGFATHLLQVMRRTRAAPVCPSTQPVAGAKSPCGAIDDRAAGGVTSLPTRRAAAYLHFLHAAQQRRAAACVFTPHTPRSGVRLHFPHAPRSGVRLHSSHAAQRHASSLAACVFTFHTPRSGVCLFAHAAQTPRSGVCK